LSPRKEHKTAK